MGVPRQNAGHWMKHLEDRFDRNSRFAPGCDLPHKRADTPGIPGKFHRLAGLEIPIQTGLFQDNVRTI